jgi:hypothetical protein
MKDWPVIVGFPETGPFRGISPGAVRSSIQATSTMAATVDHSPAREYSRRRHRIHPELLLPLNRPNSSSSSGSSTSAGSTG